MKTQLNDGPFYIVWIVCILLLLLLISCGTEPEIEDYRANVYIESFETVQNATIADLRVIASDNPLPQNIWVEFRPFLQDAFFLNVNPRTRFGITMFKKDTLYVAESVGSEFQNLY